MITSPDASNVLVTQSSANALLDWTGFNLANGETITFAQPDAMSLAINRISGGSSIINGSVVANGKVWLINTSGFLFGGTGVVNVGSFMATTAALTNPASLGISPLTFAGTTGSITNNANITAADDGAVMLLAPDVTNSGDITANSSGAPGAQIVLAGTTAYSLDPTNNLLTLSATPASRNLSTVLATGNLRSDGGTIRATSGPVNGGFTSTVNTNGVMQAQTVGTRTGQVILGGAGVTDINLAGSADARGGAGENGRQRAGDWQLY